MSKRDPIKNIRQLLSDSSSYTREEIEDAVDEVLKMKYFINEDRLVYQVSFKKIIILPVLHTNRI